MHKESRKEPRSKVGRKVWIRLDDGFSVRACKLVDLSSGGIRIEVEAPYDVAELFSLMMTRHAAPGRRCRVKWRRGSEIGAAFVRPRSAQDQL